MKKNSKFANLYLVIIFLLMYLPIGVVIVFSFNEAKLPVRFTGFSIEVVSGTDGGQCHASGASEQPDPWRGQLFCICIDRYIWGCRAVQATSEVQRHSGIHFHFAAYDS